MNDDKIIQVLIGVLFLLAVLGTVLAVAFPGPITIVCAVLNWCNFIFQGSRGL